MDPQGIVSILMVVFSTVYNFVHLFRKVLKRRRRHRQRSGSGGSRRYFHRKESENENKTH